MYWRLQLHPAKLWVEQRDLVHESGLEEGFELKAINEMSTWRTATYGMAVPFNIPFLRKATFLFLGLSRLLTASDRGFTNSCNGEGGDLEGLCLPLVAVEDASPTFPEFPFSILVAS